MLRTVVAIALLAGCGAEIDRPPNRPGLLASDPDREICTEERPTGTNFNRTVCRTAGNEDLRRAAAQDWLRGYPVDRTLLDARPVPPGGPNQ